MKARRRRRLQTLPGREVMPKSRKRKNRGKGKGAKQRRERMRKHNDAVRATLRALPGTLPLELLALELIR